MKLRTDLRVGVMGFVGVLRIFGNLIALVLWEFAANYAISVSTIVTVDGWWLGANCTLKGQNCNL